MNARIESMLKRDRAILLSASAGVSLLAWAYLFYASNDMAGMGDRMADTIPQMPGWNGAELAFAFAMWSVMMMAMMIPPAMPAAIIFAAIHRKRGEHQPIVPTGVFLGGILIVWIGFSALAAITQQGIQIAAALFPKLMGDQPILGGVLLIVAGLFQWTPLKRACLAHCRSPQSLFITEWREGINGAFLMGVKHGVHCLGCCWLLMSILFLVGTMNLAWMAVITVFILLEKTVSASPWLTRLAGLFLIGWGVWMIFGWQM